MTREEAIAKGLVPAETKHSMLRRTPWHDYSRRGTYMVTLVTHDRKPLFGRLKGSTAAGNKPFVELSPLGLAIRDEEIKKISRYYPQVEVWKLCIMPDHLHIILRVREDLPAGKHLGMVIAGFKGGCSKAALRLGATVPWAFAQGKTQGERPGNGNGRETAGTVTTVPSASPEGFSCRPGNGNGSSERPGNGNGGGAERKDRRNESGCLPVLFEAGYNDKILLHEGQLDNWKHYLDDNPRRLWLKRQNPQLFTVLSDLAVAGRRCQTVGNRFLLDIPDKMAVIVHRRYSDEEYRCLRDAWLDCGERGGVLVSAAIAPREKAVMREALERGYRIILLRENGFSPMYKPLGESFDACVEGRLLQIAPWDYHMGQQTITRSQCLSLNELAEAIVDNP